MRINNVLVVITPTTNLVELEKQKTDFDSLPYDLRRHSNDESIRRNGMDNETFYNVLKAFILYNQDTKDTKFTSDDMSSIVSEALKGSVDRAKLLDKVDEVLSVINTKSHVSKKSKLDFIAGKPNGMFKLKDEICLGSFKDPKAALKELQENIKDAKFKEDNYNTIFMKVPALVEEGFTIDRNYNEKDIFFEKIRQAEEIEKQGMVIICPPNIEFDYKYSLKELEEKFNKYNSLSDNLRDMSDQNSMALFGKDVRYMYASTKVKLISNHYDDSIESIEKTEIDEYRDSVSLEFANVDSDSISRQLKILEGMSILDHGTITESCVAEDIIKIADNKPSTFTLPSICPFFTPEEMSNLSDTIPEDFLEGYKRSCCTGLYEFNYVDKYNKVKELYFEHSQAIIKGNESDIIKLEMDMINLGWNPYVEPNTKNMDFARKRLSKYINENYDFDLIDLTKMSVVKEDIDVENISDLEPVYITLVYTGSPLGKLINKVKHSTYSHAAIGFEDDLKNLYSFNMRGKDHNGISYESLDAYIKDSKDAKLKVIAIFVTKNQKARIRAKLDYFIANHNKTKYDVRNLFRILLNKENGDSFSLKMVCSQFVDSILRAVNIDISGKPNNLVSPDDFDKADNKKMYVVFEGMAIDYDNKRTKLLINAIKLNRASVFKMVELGEAVNLLHNYDILLFKSIQIKESGNGANLLLDKINDLLTPTSVFVEARIPFRVSKDGDVEISLPSKYEEEYQKAHKLLIEYDKTSNTEGMKDELAKLWSINNSIEKKLYGKGKVDKDSLVKTRARILNDFKKYLNVVLKKEKDFSFGTYFKSSPYYDKSISIDNSTLKWTGRLIKSVMTTV